MFNDEISYIRELGWRRILKARRRSNGIRQFKSPLLSFVNTDYVSMIDWQENDITEPLLCKKLLTPNLKAILGEKFPFAFLLFLVKHKLLSEL